MEASRLFLREIQARIIRKENFAFETTLAGRGYLKLIRHIRNNGWPVELIYLALPSVEMAKLRVAERVSHGGHNIPIQDIERRFHRSLYNLFTIYGKTVNRCICCMNTGEEPITIFELQGDAREIYRQDYFQLLIKEAGL